MHFTLSCSFVALLFFPSAFGAQKCAWVIGKLNCKKNPDAVLTAEVRLYDRDGPTGNDFFDFVGTWDKDDLMGLTVPEPDGTFRLEGCADDHDWLPFVKNYPEPYVQIFHHCNRDQGEEWNTREFKVFSPETYDLGILELDY